jgi:NADH-quinone oxidoreductase subunit K
MSLENYLAVSAALFTLGIISFISRKNSIAILMGVELILNAAALNFVAFSRFSKSAASQMDGQVFAIFIILMAAAEAVVALAIALAVYTEFKEIRADKLNQLKG